VTSNEQRTPSSAGFQLARHGESRGLATSADCPLRSGDVDSLAIGGRAPIDGSALVKRAVVGDVESSAMAHARLRYAHRTLRACVSSNDGDNRGPPRPLPPGVRRYRTSRDVVRSRSRLAQLMPSGRYVPDFVTSVSESTACDVRVSSCDADGWCR
jgi:hypothetical protein